MKEASTCRIETLGDVHFEHVLGPKGNPVEDGFDGIPTRASGAKAIGLRRELRFPCGFQGLADDRLPCPVVLGGNPQWAFSLLPRFGIHVRRSGVAWPSRLRVLARCHRCTGVRDFTPSIPAVCFPRLSWVTRRTASNRAYHDLISSFCSLRAVLIAPRCVARSIRFWRRKTCRWTFFHGMSCQATFREGPCVLAHCL